MPPATDFFGVSAGEDFDEVIQPDTEAPTLSNTIGTGK